MSFSFHQGESREGKATSAHDYRLIDVG